MRQGKSPAFALGAVVLAGWIAVGAVVVLGDGDGGAEVRVGQSAPVTVATTMATGMSMPATTLDPGMNPDMTMDMEMDMAWPPDVPYTVNGEGLYVTDDGGIIIPPERQSGSHHPCYDPVYQEHYEAADALIAEVEAATANLQNVEDAIALGYVQNAPPFGGEGAHYMNPSYHDDGHILDPNRIESLVYRDRKLEAAMFVMDSPGEMGPMFAGCLALWHDHDNLCFSEDPAMNPAAMVVGIKDAAGSCWPGGTFYPTPMMLHVWVVPHPGGPFAGILT